MEENIENLLEDRENEKVISLNSLLDLFYEFNEKYVPDSAIIFFSDGAGAILDEDGNEFFEFADHIELWNYLYEKCS